MNRRGILAACLFVIPLALSFSLFGVWLDKVMLFAPLVIMVYLGAALWMCGGIGRIPPAGIPLLVFWLYSAAMIPFSSLPYETKISTLRVGCYIALYWTTANLLSRFEWRRAVLTSLFVLLVLVALYSIVHHAIAPDRLFGMERYTGYWKGGRLGGTYQCPNHIAHLYQMWIPFCLLFLFMPRFGWFWRICFAYGIGLFTLLIYQTQSRAGLLGLAAGLGTTAFFLLWRRGRRAALIALIVAPLLTVGAVGGLWAGSAMFRERMQPVVEYIQHHMDEDMIDVEYRDFRPQTWADTIDMFRERPLFGFGPGSYELMFEKYRTRVTAPRLLTVHAHNEYVEFAAEYGWVGIGLLLWILLAAGRRIIALARHAPDPHHALPAIALLAALAGTAAHSFFDFQLRIFPNALMLALLAGCAVAPALRMIPAEQKLDSPEPANLPLPHAAPPPLRTRLDTIVHFIFLTLLLPATLWSGQVMGSAWIRTAGDRAFDNKTFDRAESLFNLSARIDPQNWLAYWGLGRVYHIRGYYEIRPEPKQEWMIKKKAAFSEAHRINPVKEEVRYGLAVAELFLGNRDEGLDLLRDVAVYKRFNDFYWRKLGIELRKAGLYNEALEAFEHALRLDGRNRTVRRNIQWLKERTP